MKGDFSRLAIGQRDYSRVLMQQGRVMVDADWNELVDIFTRVERLLAADLLGPHGGPRDDLGFAITATQTNGHGDLGIGPGAYYVDGIRVANPPPEPGKASLYSAQEFLTAEKAKEFPSPPYLVYLDVWERHVTSLEDDAIREVALGGPDTTSRAEVVWQVKVRGLDQAPDLGNSCASFSISALRNWLIGLQPTIKVSAPKPDVVADDPCVSSPDARFRGAENQLYRVEIHAVEGNEATFVWSRENGSIVAAWLNTEGDVLHVTGVRDKGHGFDQGDWVELTDDLVELRGEHGVLVRLAAVDSDELMMDVATATGPIEAAPSRLVNAKVRRWDQKERTGRPLVGGAVPVKTGTEAKDWIPLEDGIQVQFQPPAGNDPADYRVGDHWVFPARVATGDVEWPQQEDGSGPKAVRPHGVVHHFAPLGLVPNAQTPLIDLRHLFEPLAACRDL